jgi:hypothetical protein
MVLFAGEARQQLLMFIYICCAIFAPLFFKGISMPFLKKIG